MYFIKFGNFCHYFDKYSFFPPLFFHWGLHSVEVDSDGSVSHAFGQFSFFFLFLKKIYLFLWYAYEHLPACMSLHHVCAWYVYMPEKGVTPPGSIGTDVSEWACGCWDRT